MPPPATADLFSDADFKAPSPPVSSAGLFELSAPMRAYLHSSTFSNARQTLGDRHGLVEALYKKDQLKIEYDSSVTRNAADTFAARSGNCLSLVIMTAAFARELGMPVHFQSVIAEPQWSRNGVVYFASTHVNLALARRPSHTYHYDPSGNFLTIDFLPPEDAQRYQSVPIDEATIEAMYLNNRAAEALARQQLDDAYWWARHAVEQHPGYTSSYNTLGVIYQSRKNYPMAERVLKRALAREPENTVLMHNLVALLSAMGKEQEASALAARVAAIDPTPPYHFFNQGMLAMEQARFTDAKALFAREVRRAPYNHEFHFWLGIAHWRLGDAHKARNQLELALNSSTTEAASERYAGKLGYLRSLLSSRQEE